MGVGAGVTAATSSLAASPAAMLGAAVVKVGAAIVVAGGLATAGYVGLRATSPKPVPAVVTTVARAGVRSRDSGRRKPFRTCVNKPEPRAVEAPAPSPAKGFARAAAHRRATPRATAAPRRTSRARRACSSRPMPIFVAVIRARRSRAYPSTPLEVPGRRLARRARRGARRGALSRGARSGRKGGGRAVSRARSAIVARHAHPRGVRRVAGIRRATRRARAPSLPTAAYDGRYPRCRDGSWLR